METHEKSASIVSPPRHHWRIPAAVTGMAVVAALCLHTGSAAHAAALGITAAAKPAGPAAHAAVAAAGTRALTGHIEAAAATSTGGVHGAFNQYDGSGGGIEFWFDPNTGALTVAVGTGIGASGGGVLGTYAAGTAPTAGSYLYASVDLSAGTYTSVNVAGGYSLSNGVFDGSVSAAVEGRTLTITSDGSSYFEVSVIAASGAPGFTGATGVAYTYYFTIPDVVDYVWDAIVHQTTGDYTLLDNYNAANETYVYEDDSSTDGTELTTTDDSGSLDDSSSDSGDSGDGGDGGDGGGCSIDATLLNDQTSTSTSTQSTNTRSVTPNLIVEDDDGDGACD